MRRDTFLQSRRSTAFTSVQSKITQQNYRSDGLYKHKGLLSSLQYLQYYLYPQFLKEFVLVSKNVKALIKK